jgi:hypothetical protein
MRLGGLVFALPTLLASRSGHAQAGPGALPSLTRVGAASTGEAPLALTVSAGYGYTEAVLGADDVHHRTFGGVAAAWRARPWLALGARLDARYDRHTGGGDDVSGAVEPRFTLRMARPFGEALRLGFELGVWLPGEEGPDGGAVSPRALGLATWRSGGLALHLNAGYHLDRSGRSIEDPDRLVPTDLVSLGVSDSPAVLAAVGLEVAVGRDALFAEASWDALVGPDAPPLSRSPLHAVIGYRHPFGRATDLVAYLDADAARRADEVNGMDPLVPIGPRLAAGLAFAYRYERPVARAATLAAPAEATRPAEPPPPPPPAVLSGRLMGPEGPLAGATVTAGGKSTTTDAEGRFELAGVPPGPVTVVVEKPGYRRIEKALSLEAGQRLGVELAGELALPDGQIRGTVMSFDGKPLAAEIRIQPGDRVLTADAQGAFQIDVPPGDYEVTVEMAGYAGSRRRVKVEQRGVTLLPIDLQRK